MKRFALALALLLLPSAAFAQCNGVFSPNTICGRTAGSGPPGQVPSSVLTGTPGGSNGQTQYNNSGNFGGYTPSGDVTVNPSTGVETIQPGAVTGPKIASGTVANSNLVPGAANTVKGSLNGSTVSDLALTSCSAIYQFTQWVSGSGWQCGIAPVLPSRAVAATLNLSAFSAITVQGYATAGDGGIATYKNIAAGAFVDTIPTSITTTNAGSGCTAGTYTVHTAGGSGIGTYGTVVVSSGAVTSTTFSTTGTGYAVGDVITPSSLANSLIPGCSVQPTWTIAAITAVTGSFSDSASNHWQLLINPNNHISVLAFGYKNDFTKAGGDGAATDNFTALQNAIWFAYGQGVEPTIDALGSLGAVVDLPPKAGMVCGSGSAGIMLPQGVTLHGAGRYSSVLKFCAAFPSGLNSITVGDSLIQLSCFGSRIEDLGIYDGGGAAGGSTAVIFSNCIQQQNFLKRVVISGQNRSCLNLQTGWGGAAFIGMEDIECGISGTTNPGMNINYPSAIIDMHTVAVEIGGSNLANNGVTITGGRVNLVGFHTEGFSTGIFMNVPNNNGISSFHHLTGTQGTCTNLVLRQSGSFASVNVIGMASGCTNTLNNAGTTTGGNIIADVVF